MSAAWIVFAHSHSYVAAAAAGWLFEGIGFYGYFIATELIFNSHKYRKYSIIKRTAMAIASSSSNLFLEFLPAEIGDNFIIRPLGMFLGPKYIHPYPVGFLIGKFSSDILFYALSIVGYEARKKILKQ